MKMEELQKFKIEIIKLARANLPLFRTDVDIAIRSDGSLCFPLDDGSDLWVGFRHIGESK